jgi:hypothetical protein
VRKAARSGLSVCGAAAVLKSKSFATTNRTPINTSFKASIWGVSIESEGVWRFESVSRSPSTLRKLSLSFEGVVSLASTGVNTWRNEGNSVINLD